MAVPACRAIGGSRLQACWLQPRTHVRTAARCSHGLSMHASWLAGWRCSAIVDGQDERCAACHAAWRRMMAMPDCPAIGGSRLQA